MGGAVQGHGAWRGDAMQHPVVRQATGGVSCADRAKRVAIYKPIEGIPEPPEKYRSIEVTEEVSKERDWLNDSARKNILYIVVTAEVTKESG